MRRFLDHNLCRSSVILLLYRPLALAQSVSVIPPNAQAAMAELQKEPFRAHMAFLADDLLEGRGTRARGHEIAARYVAAQFEAMGLKPAGQDGAYFQRVPFRQLTDLPRNSNGVTTVRRAAYILASVARIDGLAAAMAAIAAKRSHAGLFP
jgi:hypothetical protein